MVEVRKPIKFDGYNEKSLSKVTIKNTEDANRQKQSQTKKIEKLKATGHEGEGGEKKRLRTKTREREEKTTTIKVRQVATWESLGGGRVSEGKVKMKAVEIKSKGVISRNGMQITMYTKSARKWTNMTQRTRKKRRKDTHRTMRQIAGGRGAIQKKLYRSSGGKQEWTLRHKRSRVMTGAIQRGMRLTRRDR